MAKTLYIEDALLTLLLKHFGLNWNEDDYYLSFNDGTELAVDDYVYLDIPATEVEVEDKIQTQVDTMICDGILLFGDGCMEFHDKEECDAYHWENFSDESILKITEIVKELV